MGLRILPRIVRIWLEIDRNMNIWNPQVPRNHKSRGPAVIRFILMDEMSSPGIHFWLQKNCEKFIVFFEPFFCE